MDDLERAIAQIVAGYPEELARMVLEKFKAWLTTNPLNLKDIGGTLRPGQLPPGTLFTTTTPTQGQTPVYNSSTGRLDWITPTTADQILTDDSYDTLVDDDGGVLTGD